MKQNVQKIFLLLYILLPSTATAVELEKAPRPDAIPTSSAEAIVGAQGCDISPLVAAVLATKVHLGTVHDDSCCNSALGILGNACTILGPDASISGTLLELTYIGTAVQDILLILTTCCAETASEFAQTWTILAELQNTITACCAAEQQDFVNTWTIIAGIIATQTTCCAHEQQDFANTWTILAEIQSTITTGCATISAVGGCDFLINQSDIPYVITQPGRYCVISPLTFSSGAAITIQGTENVLLDLHGHTMNGQQEAGDAAIVINNSAQVTVQNGSFLGTGTAVIISGASQGVLLDNVISVSHLDVGVNISNAQGVTLQQVGLYPAAGAEGILLVSSTQCTLQGSRIGNAAFRPTTGIAATNVTSMNVNNSSIAYCTVKGLSAQNCQGSSIENSYFFDNSGGDVTFSNCRNIIVGQIISFGSGATNYVVQNSDNATYAENIFFNTSENSNIIFDSASNNNVITNEVLYPGFLINNGNNIVIAENTIFGQNSSSSNGIYIAQPSTTSLIKQNVVLAGYTAVNITPNCTNSTIEQCTLLSSYPGAGIALNETATVKISDCNCIYPQGNGIVILATAQNSTTASVQVLNNYVLGTEGGIVIGEFGTYGTILNIQLVSNRIENCTTGLENYGDASTWSVYNNCSTDSENLFNVPDLVYINPANVITSDGFWLNVLSDVV